MTRQYQLESALLPQGWVCDARVSVADDGHITAIALSSDPADIGAAVDGTTFPLERVAGFVVPGMANAHSHAFQRGMAGNTEYRLSARDSFWTWRNAMYALANRIEPDDLRVLATQLFIEMLKAGYTSVAEFHYLHRQPDGGSLPRRPRSMGCGDRRQHRRRHRTHAVADALPDQRFRRCAAACRPGALRPRHRLVPARHRGPRGRRETPRAGDAAHRRRLPQPARRAARHAAGDRQGAARHRCDAAVARARRRTSEGGGVLPAQHTGRRPIELLLDTGLLDAGVVPGARHARHGRRGQRNGGKWRRGVRLHQHGSQPGRRLLRRRRLPNARAVGCASDRTANRR